MLSPSGYYHKYLKKLYKHIIPNGRTLLVIDSLSQKVSGKYDYIILPNTLAYSEDIQSYVNNLKRNLHPRGRIIVIYFNFLWKPFHALATKFGLRKHERIEPNWLNQDDFQNMFELCEFNEVKRSRRMLIPIDLHFFSHFVNKYIAPLPFFNNFCLITYQVFALKSRPKDYSVSVIIPARNEEGNIKGVLKKVPSLGSKTEIIFVEGNSKDSTYQAIEKEIAQNTTSHQTSLYKQKGKGKGDAVRLGFAKAKNDILMILDADLTVPPNDLEKFYTVLALGLADFANGSRLVYPMESQAMRTLNYMGNKFFSIAFSYLLEQKVKDTLCGTKVLFKTDYDLIAKNRKYFGDFDPFGDYDLLFGATRLNLKIRDVAIKYRDRTYGTTNISRFRHGWLLIKMTIFATQKLKFL